jgi:exopolysaccharide production protein ExoZ
VNRVASRNGAPAIPAPARLLALDALRGVMALAVAVYHFQVWTHVLKAGSLASSSVIAFGIHSVEGFFIISGFCFFYLYQQQSFDLAQGRAFYIKRFFRIAPLYYAVLLLNFVLHERVGPFTWGRLLENLTLSFGLFHPNHAMVLGGWSIGLEYVFYLAFPLLLLLARLKGGLPVLLLLLALLAWPLNFHEVPAAPELQRFNAYVRLPNHAFLFVLGGVFAQVRLRSRLRLSTLALCLLLGSVLCLFLRWLPLFYDHFFVMTGSPRVVCLVACSLLVLGCGLHRVGPSRLLRPFVWLGDLSYAVYLLHPFAWLITSRLLAVSEQPRFAFGLGIALTLGLGALFHYLLERPLLTLGRLLAQRTVLTETTVVASSLHR